MLVLITGACGYIGGQTALHLRESGIKIIGIDTHPCPVNLVSVMDRCYQEDFSSQHGLDIIDRTRPDAIIHCAGSSLVGPSHMDPGTYYENNFVRTKRLLDHMVRKKIETKIIFSSSAAVYGEPLSTPILESDARLPVSSYGESKLMVEMMLERYHRAHGVKYASLRYFNACGADPWGRHGQKSGATHIIARVLESLRGYQTFRLNGKDYDTPDGTCIRDYVHVEDIARAHALCLNDRLSCDCYNLGTSTGISNLEIMSRCEKITGRSLRYDIGARRPGDPAYLTASPEKFQSRTGWYARYTIDHIIDHAWNWYKN